MTLRQWLRRTRLQAQAQGQGGLAVPMPGKRQDREALWLLSDYRVGYVAGGVVWLVKWKPK